MKKSLQYQVSKLLVVISIGARKELEKHSALALFHILHACVYLGLHICSHMHISVHVCSCYYVHILCTWAYKMHITVCINQWQSQQLLVLYPKETCLKHVSRTFHGPYWEALHLLYIFQKFLAAKISGKENVTSCVSKWCESSNKDWKSHHTNHISYIIIDLSGKSPFGAKRS